MNVLYNEMANIILTDIDKFVPSKYNIEYRKNKTVVDLQKLVDSIQLKSSEFENNITILSVSLKSIFKLMRKRKYTLVYSLNGVIHQDFINKTDEELIKIKASIGKDTIILNGHCKTEGQ